MYKCYFQFTQTPIPWILTICDIWYINYHDLGNLYVLKHRVRISSSVGMSKYEPEAMHWSASMREVGVWPLFRMGGNSDFAWIGIWRMMLYCQLSNWMIPANLITMSLKHLDFSHEDSTLNIIQDTAQKVTNHLQCIYFSLPV